MTSVRPLEHSIDVGRVAGWMARQRGQVTVERLADATGFSRQHFTRVFRTAVGVGPKTCSQL
jgi:transcriptional regulator GlxA family with amidase domain